MRKSANEIYLDDCDENEMYRDLVMIAEKESEAENQRVQRIKNMKINSEYEKQGKDNKRNKNYRNFRRNNKNEH
jgi:hypothetical protein